MEIHGMPLLRRAGSVPRLDERRLACGIDATWIVMAYAVRATMHIDQRKEQFSRAYVHAVASVAGFSLASPVVDDDSVDVIFCSRGKGGTLRAPRLEAQLKLVDRDHA
jgi:hypothetical protein